jgi:uncharacterized oligopeptide transporter (OPT) family protein
MVELIILDGTAMIMGATWAYLWAKRNRPSFETIGFAIAAGLIAGEGIGGCVNAVLQVANVAGDRFGTTVLCPSGRCAG